jgi:hypothetical protein
MRLEQQFELKPPLTFSSNGHGVADAKGAGQRKAAGPGRRAQEID